MKRILSYLLLSIVLLLCYIPVQAEESDLYPLSRSDLEQFSDDVNKALKQYHTSLSSNEERSVLSPVQKLVENHVKEQGLTNPSWPWFDYTYTRQWNLLCVETRVDAKDAEKKKHSIQVYGEVFPMDGNIEVVYLKVDDTELINRRSELPDPLWSEIKTHAINSRTGVDLTVLSKEELECLRNDIKAAISENHSVDSKGERETGKLVENYVNDYFTKQGYTVSWPWFDYTYTCDWGLFTEKTEVTCKNADKKKSQHKIYAEVYFDGNNYDIIYLTIGTEVMVDTRSQVQGTSYQVYLKSQRYAEAQDHWEAGRYAEAQDVFQGLRDFSNSQDMVLACIEQLMGADYAQAVALFDTGKYEEARQAFLALGDHADSAEKAQRCQEKLNQIQYDEAVALMQSGGYEDAMLLFSKLGDYSDSVAMADRCLTTIQDSKYQQACQLRDQQLYAEAISLFSELGDYKDSESQVASCTEAYNEALYSTAVSAMGAGEYANALKTLLVLDAYKDAHALASVCQDELNKETYAQATTLLSGGHFDEAYTLFASLGGYSDSNDMAERCLKSKANVDRKIVFDETEIIIYLNKSLQLKPTIETISADAPAQSNVVYQSGDTSVARVLKNGTINAVKEGTARIICSTEDNPDNITELIVRVVLPVQRVSLDRSEMKIQMDVKNPSASAASLQAMISPTTAYDQTITWTSSNEKVACVDAHGKVTPVGPGTTTITATANDKTNGVRKASCTVRVTMAVSEIQLDKKEGIVFIGKTEKLTATVVPENAANKQLTWSSSDKKVATVNSYGVVTGVASGSATITAKAANGVEASYAVTVKQGPATFTVSVSATMVSNDHVGNNWSKVFFVDDKKFSGSTTFTAEVGQAVVISGEITDNDSNPDTGYFRINIAMTEDVFKNGYTETREVSVRENGGRYSGHYAEWRVVIKVKKR